MLSSRVFRIALVTFFLIGCPLLRAQKMREPIKPHIEPKKRSENLRPKPPKPMPKPLTSLERKSLHATKIPSGSVVDLADKKDEGEGEDSNEFGASDVHGHTHGHTHGHHGAGCDLLGTESERQQCEEIARQKRLKELNENRPQK